MINVYGILKVSATASDEEIKASYKRLSREYHPDHGGDPERMAQLNEAYNLINTPEKRRKYDTDNAFSTTFRQWETIFGKSNVAKDFGKAPVDNGKAVRGSDIDLTVHVPMRSFVKGERIMIASYVKRMECLECSGSGVKSMHKCPACGGNGKIRNIDPASSADRIRKCDKCDGTGEIVKESCDACGGCGYTEKECKYTFTYKPFTLDTVVVGKGNEGMFGGENGSLRMKFVADTDSDNGISFADGRFTKVIQIHPEDFVLGTTVDFDFYGRMVVYHMEPCGSYSFMGTVSNVAGTGYPLDIDFVPMAEDDSSIGAIQGAMGSVRAARTEEKS